MIEVSKQVWRRWEKLSAEDNKPFISLLLVCALASEDVRVLVEEAAEEVEATLECEWERARASGRNVDLGVGGLSSVVMPAGVVITIGGGAEQFEEQVGLLVEGLERRGVAGKLGVLKSPRAKPLPFVVPLVECRLRVLGERYHLSGPHYRWRVDREAWAAVIAAGVRWCRQVPGQETVEADPSPRVVIGPGEDAFGLVIAAADANEMATVDFTCGRPERWRMVAVEPYKMRIALIEASERIGENGWRDAVASMVAFLRENDELMLYALVKHGTSLLAARGGYSLITDWPQRAGFHAPFRSEPEFEDAHAPDAFAVQLLGPRYAGRIPTGGAWRQTQLGHDRVLVEHTSPEEWFGVPFAYLGGLGYSHLDPPDVLERAREDFARILFTDELLRQGS